MFWHKIIKKLIRDDRFVWKKKTVLIIGDDLPPDGSVEHDIASAGPFDVVVAKTGREGIKLSRRINPDIIFVDWDINGPGGSEVIFQIRRLKKTRTVPLCLMMSGDRLLDYELTQSAGIKDCITKPFSGEKLVGLILLRTS